MLVPLGKEKHFKRSVKVVGLLVAEVFVFYAFGLL